MASWLDRTAYSIKTYCPWIYDLMAKGNAALTVALYTGRIRRALSQATVTGTVFGAPATIRPLNSGDLDALDAFVSSTPEEHLRYFHPHRMNRESLQQVLKSQAILTYGLFIENELAAYLILKLFATGRAYLGRLVAPSLAGQGIGKWLAKYLYWQGYNLGFRVCGTMNLQNLPSKHSHASIRPFSIVAPLSTGYHLVEFHILGSDAHPPKLCIERKPRSAESSAAQCTPPAELQAR